MPFVEFIAVAAGGISPPSPGTYNLLDEISPTAKPFVGCGPICISRDGSTVFAVGIDASGIGVWAWRWNGTNWPNLQIIRIGTSGDHSGTDASYATLVCSLDGSRMFLGLRLAVSGDGVVYAFEESSADTWTQMQRIAPSASGNVGAFGYSIDCDNAGARLIVGEPSIALGDGSYGQACVYLESGGTFSLEQKLENTAWSFFNGFLTGLGSAALISGDGAVAVLGNAGDLSPGFVGFGAFESWTRSGTVWTFEDRQYPPDDDGSLGYFGDQTTAIDEAGVKMLSASFQTHDAAVYYTRSGGAWTYQSTTSGLGGSSPSFGAGALQMSEDGAVAVYGDFEYDSAKGRIERWDAAWALDEYISPTSPTVNQRHGRGVDISGDGTIVVWTHGTNPPDASATPGDRVYAKVY